MGNDGLTGPDGERLASYLRRRVDMRSDTQLGSGDRFRVALVTHVYHKDDPLNRSRSYAEYDLVTMNHLACVELYRVPVLGFHLSDDSGQVEILKACSELPETDDETQFYLNFMASDGDLVVVGFIDGMYPMIFGTANHLRTDEDTAPWFTDSTKGETRKIFHKDSYIEMQQDGKMQIEIKDGQQITITIDTVQVLKLWEDAGILKIELGTGVSLEKTLLAETFQTWWNTNIQNHVHTNPEGGNTGPMGIVFDAGSLSDKVKNY